MLEKLHSVYMSTLELLPQ